MISILRFAPLITRVSISSRVGSRRQKCSRLAAKCGVQALMFCGVWGTSSAQTAHFAGLETVVASNDLSNPHQVAVDSFGNVYIADVSNNRVLKESLTANGYQESVVSSTGLKTPAGVAVDSSGNVYIADSGNNRILMEQPAGGTYTQVAIPITGLNLPLSIAVDGKGNLYISDWGNARVVKESLLGSNYSQSFVLGGPNPDGVAVDASGNVYICAPGYNEVYKMTPNGSGYSPSFVGSGLSAPHGVTVDEFGVVYVAESGNSQIVREVPNGSTYNQSVILATGTVQPQAISSDANGNLYFNDPTGGRVLKSALSAANLGSSAVGVAAGDSSLIFSFDSSGSVSAPSVVTQGIAGLDFIDAGTGTCTTNGTSYEYTTGSTCTIDVSFKPTHPGARYGAGLLLNSSGSVIATAYVLGTGVGPRLSFSSATVSKLSLPNVTNPYAVAVDAAGNLYIAQAILAYDPSNALIKETWNGAGYTPSIIVAGLGYPTSVAVDGAGNVYVGDQDGFTVYKETPTASGGYQQSVVDSTLGTVGGLAVDAFGNVYIGRGGIGIEKETLSAGSYVRSNIFPDAGNSGFTVDSSGTLYLGINGQGNFKEVPTGGGYVQIPISVEGIEGVDGFGNLYCFGSNGVFEEVLSGNSYIQKALATGVAGLGLAIDGSGNVYVANDGNQYVKEINILQAPALHFAATAVGHTSSDSPQTVAIENSGNAAMNVPQPTQGTNPSIPSGFTVNDNAASACPLVDASSTSAGTLAAGALCDLTISFTPQQSTDTSGWLTYTYDGPSQTSALYQTSAIPLIAGGVRIASTLTWTNPSSIVYGTALGGQQLNARANVLGTFSYSPASGSILTVGSHTISVTFTPADSTDFTTATTQVTIIVARATPTITWTAPSAITYGTALSSTQLTASTPVFGTFSYSPAAGAVLTAGAQTLNVKFTPTDTSDYTTATAQVTLTVNQATPTITWATPSSITYGTALSATQLDGTSSVPGPFSYSSPAGTILTAGYQGITATLTPTDTTDYKTDTDTIYLTVNKATPTIAWAAPAAITHGTALSAAQLNAKSTVQGTFVYVPAIGTVLPAGTQKLSVTLTPNDLTDYMTATATVSLTVNQFPLTVTWATPASIVYGTGLSAVQLDATTTVLGTFVYTPLAGTIPAVGLDTLSVKFTPTNTTLYSPATATVQLMVVQLSAITSPTPGSQLATTTTFTWSSGTGVTQYDLWLGTTPGSYNLYNSGHTTALSATVSGIPTNGSTVYAQLYSYVGGVWRYATYTFIAAGPPQLTSPTPGGILSPSATFAWSAEGTGVTQFALWVGTTGPGSSNLYNSGHTTATSATVTGLPTNGSTIYAEFFYFTGGVWKYTNYTYIASGPPAMISPKPGSVLGTSASFFWSPGIGATMSELTLGTTGPGSSNLFSSGATTANTATVTGIPSTGGTVYAQLGSYIGGVWQYLNYTYTETAPPLKSALITPTAGSVLGGSTNITWTTGSQVTLYDLWVGTTGPGSSNLYNSGHTTAMSSGAVSVPQNGETVYVELFSYLNGAWLYTNYTFKAQ